MYRTVWLTGQLLNTLEMYFTKRIPHDSTFYEVPYRQLKVEILSIYLTVFHTCNWHSLHE